MTKINDVNWQELSAPSIPRWLQDIQSEKGNSKAFVESYNALWQFLVPDYADWKTSLEMMKSDAHHMVVPFLIDILDNDKDRSKAGSILDLLDCLARRWYVRGDFTKDDPNRISYEIWARRLNNAVREGIPVYQRLLNELTGFGKDIAQGLLGMLEQTKTE